MQTKWKWRITSDFNFIWKCLKVSVTDRQDIGN